MDVKLYSISDDDRVVNKTLGTAKEYSCTFRNTEEILNPVIRINTSDNLSDYNYAYVQRYGRYYFVKPAVGPNNLWTLSAHVDVLMSHKTELLSLSGTMVRNENAYNGYLIDPEFKANAYKKIVTKQFPHAMTEDCFILMTVG